MAYVILVLFSTGQTLSCEATFYFLSLRLLTVANEKPTQFIQRNVNLRDKIRLVKNCLKICCFKMSYFV